MMKTTVQKTAIAAALLAALTLAAAFGPSATMAADTAGAAHTAAHGCGTDDRCAPTPSPVRCVDHCIAIFLATYLSSPAAPVNAAFLAVAAFLVALPALMMPPRRVFPVGSGTPLRGPEELLSVQRRE